MPRVRPPSAAAVGSASSSASTSSMAEARDQALAKALEQVAWLMDRAFKVPGTNIEVGLDALLGLLPVGGDVLTGIVQVAIVLLAVAHYRVPKAVAARMATNVLLDVGIGAIPGIGDIFDVFFKANTRNLQLVKQIQTHASRGEPMPAKSSVWYLIGIGTVLLTALGFVIALFVVLLLWLFSVLRDGPAPIG